MPELSPDLERAASELWSKENPGVSAFACDQSTKERYRLRIMAIMTPNIECPCCHGQKHLLVYDAAEPDSPPAKMMCCHCGGLGVVEPNNRSTNTFE